MSYLKDTSLPTSPKNLVNLSNFSVRNQALENKVQEVRGYSNSFIGGPLVPNAPLMLNGNVPIQVSFLDKLSAPHVQQIYLPPGYKASSGGMHPNERVDTVI